MLTLAQYMLKILHGIILPFARLQIERLFDEDSVDFGVHIIERIVST